MQQGDSTRQGHATRPGDPGPGPHPCDDFTRRIGEALLRLKHGMRGMLWAEAGRAGLSKTQAETLLALRCAPGPLSPGALAEQFGATPPTISDVLGTLERKGLVERRHPEGNRRQVRVSLTPEGEETACRLDGWNAVLAEALEELPLQDREVLYRSVLRLVSAMERSGQIAARACTGCTHFDVEVTPETGPGHCCRLTNCSLTDAELRMDCPDFVMQAR